MRQCGLYLNRGALILITFFIPLAIVPAIFAEPIFLACGQDPDVARLTAIQVRLMLPSILFQGLYDLSKRWLACQRLSFVPMVCMIVGTVVHIPLCFLFVNGLDMGIEGLAVASGVKDTILLITIYLYARCSPQISEVLQPLDRDAFKGWGLYLKVCLPSTAMLCSEWWAFEVLTLLGGILGVMELASLTICLNLHALLFRIPLGITEATGALLGNSIGANNVPLAKRFFALIFKIATFVMCLISSLIVLGRKQLVNFFTDDEELGEMTEQVLIVLGCAFVVDGMQGICHGPLRALSLQTKGSVVALVCWWGVALPFGALLAFRYEMGLVGLMLGFATASIIQLVAFSIIFLRKDWSMVAKEARERLEA